MFQCGFVGAALVWQSSANATVASDVVAKNNTDCHETLDLTEVKAAASAPLEKRDKDSNGTLDTDEIGGLNGK